MRSHPTGPTPAERLADLVDRLLGRPPRLAPVPVPVTVRPQAPLRIPVDRR